MRIRTAIAGLLALLLAVPSIVLATSVKQMNLEEMSVRADKIFRGTVISIQQGSVEAGGAELPTLTYTIQVNDALKGDFIEAKEGVRIAKITMISDGKAPASAGGLQKFSIFRDVPRLDVGRDYLLFTSAPSSIGLSTTIGLGQGCFDIVGSTALNRAGNVGLFQGAFAAAPAKGPIAVDELTSRIRSILAAPK